MILNFSTKEYLENKIKEEFFDYNLFYKLLKELNFDFTAKLNEKLILKTYLEDENKNRILDLEEISQTLTQKAQKRAINEEDIKEKLSEIGDSEFTVKNIKIDIDENIFIPLSELKNIKRNVVEKFREKILSYFRRDLDRELKENNQGYFKLEIEKDEPKDLEIRVIVSNEEHKNFLEKIDTNLGDRWQNVGGSW